jgi:hypothetical protein
MGGLFGGGSSNNGAAATEQQMMAQSTAAEQQATAEEQTVAAQAQALANQAVPATPAVMINPPIPSPNSPEVIEAQNNAAAASMQRQGRASTIIGQQAQGPARTAPSDTYSSMKLGPNS